jgi:hypothetical protein
MKGKNEDHRLSSVEGPLEGADPESILEGGSAPTVGDGIMGLHGN